MRYPLCKCRDHFLHFHILISLFPDAGGSDAGKAQGAASLWTVLMDAHARRDIRKAWRRISLSSLRQIESRGEVLRFNLFGRGQFTDLGQIVAIFTSAHIAQAFDLRNQRSQSDFV